MNISPTRAFPRGMRSEVTVRYNCLNNSLWTNIRVYFALTLVSVGVWVDTKMDTLIVWLLLVFVSDYSSWPLVDRLTAAIMQTHTAGGWSSFYQQTHGASWEVRFSLAVSHTLAFLIRFISSEGAGWNRSGFFDSLRLNLPSSDETKHVTVLAKPAPAAPSSPTQPTSLQGILQQGVEALWPLRHSDMLVLITSPCVFRWLTPD